MKRMPTAKINCGSEGSGNTRATGPNGTVSSKELAAAVLACEAAAIAAILPNRPPAESTACRLAESTPSMFLFRRLAKGSWPPSSTLLTGQRLHGDPPCAMILLVLSCTDALIAATLIFALCLAQDACTSRQFPGRGRCLSCL